MYEIRFTIYPADPDAPKQMHGLLYVEEIDFDIDCPSDAEELISDNIHNIMDEFGVYSNNDWKVHEVKETQKSFPNGHVKEFNYPAVQSRLKAIQKAKKKAAMLQNFMQNKLETFKVQKKHVKFDEKKGKVVVYNPSIQESFELDVDTLWSQFEKASIDGELSLTNDFGEQIFTAANEQMVSMVAPDIRVIDLERLGDGDPQSMFAPLKGGIYIFDDCLVFGDNARTKYLELNLTALAKQSYKLGLSQGDVTPQKLLK
jgi:hypothetical protein